MVTDNNYLNTIYIVPDESKTKTIEVFKEHMKAKQIWTSPYKFLNNVQEEAAKLAFTKPFQLIQGPPGYTQNRAIAIYMLVIILTL